MSRGGLRGVVLVVMIFTAAGVTIYQKRKEMQALAWPEAQAVITRSRVDSTYDREEAGLHNGTIVIGGSRDDGRTHKVLVTKFRPDIAYRYEVDGRSYAGSQTNIRKVSRERDTVERLLARYPVGAAVSVHYNPADPAEAMLLD
jgi:hypothetical protein